MLTTNIKICVLTLMHWGLGMAINLLLILLLLKFINSFLFVTAIKLGTKAQKAKNVSWKIKKKLLYFILISGFINKVYNELLDSC